MRNFTLSAKNAAEMERKMKFDLSSRLVYFSKIVLMFITTTWPALAADITIQFEESAKRGVSVPPYLQRDLLGFKNGMSVDEVLAALDGWEIENIKSRYTYEFHKDGRDFTSETADFLKNIRATKIKQDGTEDLILFHFTSPLAGNKLFLIYNLKQTNESALPTVRNIYDALVEKWGTMAFYALSRQDFARFDGVWQFDVKGKSIYKEFCTYERASKFIYYFGQKVPLMQYLGETLPESVSKAIESTRELQSYGCSLSIVMSIPTPNNINGDLNHPVYFVRAAIYDITLHNLDLQLNLDLFKKEEAAFAPAPVPEAPKIIPKF